MVKSYGFECSDSPAGTNDNYASSCDITIDGIIWNVTGNSKMNPWRIGGKAITDADRAIYSKTAIDDDCKKLEITHGAASNITVNSMKLEVYSTADLCTAGAAGNVCTVSGTFAANATVEFEVPEGISWKGRYYRIVYNVTNTTKTNNRYIEFKGLQFYK